MKKLTGVGSRDCPKNILDLIVKIAREKAKDGWILRSGAADGCDAAFEKGFDLEGGTKEIYLPWKNFNKNPSPLYKFSKELTEKSYKIASKIHPAWDKCSDAAKKLHGRNIFQVLGKTLDDPSDLLICYTLDGKDVGGTRTAIVLARQYNIKIVNLGSESYLIDD